MQTSNSAIGEYTLLSNAIKVGNKNKIVHHIYQLLKQKEDPHKIMNQILFQMNQLLPIGYAIDQQLSSDQISTKLGKHPFFIKKLMQTLQKTRFEKN